MASRASDVEVQTALELQALIRSSDGGEGSPQATDDEFKGEDAEMTAVVSVAWWALVAALFHTPALYYGLGTF